MSSAAEAAAPAEAGGNLASLGLIQAFRMASGVAVNVMVMRSLGVEGFGVYGYVTTLVGLASFGSTMGMDRLLKREMARDPESARRYVATGLAASTLLSVTTGVALLAWAWAVDGRPVVLLAAALAATALGLQSLAVVPNSYFHAIRRMRLGVRGNVAGRALLVLATALFLWQQLGVLAVFAAQVLDAAVTLGIVWFIFRRQLGATALGTTGPEVRALIRASLPFGLNALFGSIYLSVDVLLLAWMRGDEEVGIYRAAVMLISLFPILAETLTTGIYPRMSRHLGRSDLAGTELRFATRILLGISVPAAVGGILTAAPLMVLLGGPEFAVSALPFIVMAPLLPLRFLNNGYGMTLSALDRQEDRTRGVFFAAALNVGVNLVVIPRYGALGAAATTLLTEVLLAAWMRWRIAPLVTGLGLGDTLVRVGIPSAAMAAAILLVPPAHVLLTIALGVLVYGVCGRLSGAWHPSDLRRLRRV
ncbi:MAG: flippase [Pseudomonadota bacterium]|nr:flippase [Pseudomonadota bacterium]